MIPGRDDYLYLYRAAWEVLRLRHMRGIADIRKSLFAPRYIEGRGIPEERDLYRKAVEYFGLKGIAADIGCSCNYFPAAGLINGGMDKVFRVDPKESDSIEDAFATDREIVGVKWNYHNSLPFEDDFLDVVVLNRVCSGKSPYALNIPKMRSLFHRCHRVLRDEGKIVIVDGLRHGFAPSEVHTRDVPPVLASAGFKVNLVITDEDNQSPNVLMLATKEEKAIPYNGHRRRGFVYLPLSDWASSIKHFLFGAQLNNVRFHHEPGVIGRGSGTNGRGKTESRQRRLKRALSRHAGEINCLIARQRSLLRNDNFTDTLTLEISQALGVLVGIYGERKVISFYLDRYFKAKDSGELNKYAWILGSILWGRSSRYKIYFELLSLRAKDAFKEKFPFHEPDEDLGIHVVRPFDDLESLLEFIFRKHEYMVVYYPHPDEVDGDTRFRFTLLNVGNELFLGAVDGMEKDTKEKLGFKGKVAESVARQIGLINGKGVLIIVDGLAYTAKYSQHLAPYCRFELVGHSHPYNNPWVYSPPDSKGYRTHPNTLLPGAFDLDEAKRLEEERQKKTYSEEDQRRGLKVSEVIGAFNESLRFLQDGDDWFRRLLLERQKSRVAAESQNNQKVSDADDDLPATCAHPRCVLPDTMRSSQEKAYNAQLAVGQRYGFFGFGLRAFLKNNRIRAPSSSAGSVEDLDLPCPSKKNIGKATAVFRMIKTIFDTGNIGKVDENVNIMISTRCPLNCPHCVAMDLMQARPCLDYDKTKLKALFDELRGYKSIYLVGGEPMAYMKKKFNDLEVTDDFIEIVNYAAERVGEVYIDTNGIMIPQGFRQARKFFAQFPDNVVWVLSIDEFHRDQIQERYQRKSGDISRMLLRCEKECGISVEYNIRTSIKEPPQPGFYSFRYTEEKEAHESYERELQGLLDEHGLAEEYKNYPDKFAINSLLAQGNARTIGTNYAKVSYLTTRDILKHSNDPREFFLFISTEGELVTSDHAAFLVNRPPLTVFGNTYSHSLAHIFFYSILGHCIDFPGYPQAEPLLKAAYLQEYCRAKDAIADLRVKAKTLHKPGKKYAWIYKEMLEYPFTPLSLLAIPYRLEQFFKTEREYLDETIEVVREAASYVTWEVKFDDPFLYRVFMRRHVDCVGSAERIAELIVGWIRGDIVPSGFFVPVENGLFVNGTTVLPKVKLCKFVAGAMGEGKQTHPVVEFESLIKGIAKYLGRGGARALYSKINRELSALSIEELKLHQYTDPFDFFDRYKQARILTQNDLVRLRKFLASGPVIEKDKHRRASRRRLDDLIESHSLFDMCDLFWQETHRHHEGYPQLIRFLLRKLSWTTKGSISYHTRYNLLHFIGLHCCGEVRSYLSQLLRIFRITNKDPEREEVVNILMRHGIRKETVYTTGSLCGREEITLRDGLCLDILAGLLIGGARSTRRAALRRLVHFREPDYTEGTYPIRKEDVAFFTSYVASELLATGAQRKIFRDALKRMKFRGYSGEPLEEANRLVTARLRTLDTIRKPMADRLMEKYPSKRLVDMRGVLGVRRQSKRGAGVILFSLADLLLLLAFIPPSVAQW
ncbi:radical SAM protein, partial [Candidatus Omnitrophota bacterium]